MRALRVRVRGPGIYVYPNKRAEEGALKSGDHGAHEDFFTVGHGVIFNILKRAI
jgi:hypothetical protein